MKTYEKKSIVLLFISIIIFIFSFIFKNEPEIQKMIIGVAAVYIITAACIYIGLL